ncbi:hypothetical protein ACG7TL_008963 [Trametes sanguinea]
MCETVGITLLAYDHLLTLSGEIHFVWNRKFSGATVLFVLNRYVNLFSKIVLPISTFWWPNQTDKSCAAPVILTEIFTVIAYFVAAVSFVTHSFAIAVDLLVSWIKTYEIKRLSRGLQSNATFSALILRDGTLYFGTLLALNVADLIVLRSNVLFDPLPVFIDVFTCILISRFMLNLRQVAEVGSGNPSSTFRTDATSRMSTVHFAANLVGDLGSPLAHVGWKPALESEDSEAQSHADNDDDLVFSRDVLIEIESSANTLAPDSDVLARVDSRSTQLC